MTHESLPPEPLPPGAVPPELNAAIQRLGQAVYTEIAAQHTAKPWIRVLLDVRYDRDGSSSIAKMCLLEKDQDWIMLEVSNEIRRSVVALREIRMGTVEDPLSDEWFGILFSIESDSQCNLTFDYDHTCAEDSSF